MKENELFQNIEKAISTQKPVWLGVWGPENLDIWLTVGEEPTPREIVAAAEREACAKVCEDLYKKWVDDLVNDTDDIADSGAPDCVDCKVAIRARGQA
jgi:hypothetical protein